MMKKVFTLLLAGALCSSMAWAQTSYTLDVYPGSANNYSKVVTTAAEWEAVLVDCPNAVAFIDGTETAGDPNVAFAESTHNVVIKYPGDGFYDDSYVCPNLILTDLKNHKTATEADAAETNFYSPVDFDVTAGSYSRPLKAGYNSACVPFIININDFAGDQVATYTKYVKSENNAYFEDQTTNVSAGTAVIIKLAAAKNWQADLAGKLIKGEPVKGTSFQGVFVTDNYAGMYSVAPANDYFSPLAGNLYPFRACFTLTGGDVTPGGIVPTAPRLVILNAGEASGLDAVNANQEDMKFMQDGRLMIRHNGVVYNAAGKMLK